MSMLPMSHSSQSLHSPGIGMQHHPVRSTSSSALSGANSPNFFVRSTSAGPLAGHSGTPSPSLGASGIRDSPVTHPPASPRVPTSSAQSQSSFIPPSLATSLGHQHGSYDARLVASTINRIEATSGLGSASGNLPGGSNSTQNAGLTSGASVPGDSDAWTAVCVRTLPLFNGEGQRGYLEDLNDLVTLHVKHTVQRLGPTSAVIHTMHNDLTDVLAMGMLTLNTKLINLSDEKLLVRITEVWNFFFIGCLPYIEGIFLPLRTDTSIRQIQAAAQVRNHAKSVSEQSDRQMKDSDGVDIRGTALKSFRDHLVLPIVDRLAVIFSAAASPGQTQPIEPGTYANTSINIVATARTASARRLQMVSVLASLQTGDDRQNATEALARALRSGMAIPLREHAMFIKGAHNGQRPSRGFSCSQTELPAGPAPSVRAQMSNPAPPSSVYQPTVFTA